MRDQLLGAIQPMLSILLDPGESVIGEASRFAWMTDSIEMAVADETAVWVYTATGEPGVVAFAAQRPGHIISVEVSPQDEGYLVRRSDFMARTPGVQVRADPAEYGLGLWRIGGSGRAWVELAGDVVRRELTADQSLRARPGHVGMFDGTIAIQVTQVHGTLRPEQRLSLRRAVRPGRGLAAVNAFRRGAVTGRARPSGLVRLHRPASHARHGSSRRYRTSMTP